jgi:hypothetical protein
MRKIGLLLVLLGATLAVFGARAIAEEGLPPGPNRELVIHTCNACHEISMLTDTGGLDRKDWEDTLQEMMSYGAQVTPAERTLILDYLVTALPPKKQ